MQIILAERGLLQLAGYTKVTPLAKGIARFHVHVHVRPQEKELSTCHNKGLWDDWESKFFTNRMVRFYEK